MICVLMALKAEQVETRRAGTHCAMPECVMIWVQHCLVECDAAGIFFLTSRTRSEHTATPFQLLSLFVLSLILVKLVFPSVGSLEVHIERQCGVSQSNLVLSRAAKAHLMQLKVWLVAD